MKKILLSMAIILNGLTVQPAIATIPTFSTTAMAQHTLADLSLEAIIAELYDGKAYDTYIHDDTIKTMSYMSLGSINDDYNQQTVAVMHPMVTYSNTLGEPRYLVIIEKVRMRSKDHKLITCHACAGSADVYIFKRLGSGAYQLVSRSSDDVEFSGSWGRMSLDTATLQGNIEPLGKRLVGSLFKNGYLSTGISEEWWEVLHLAEDDYVKIYNLGDAGGDSSGYFEEDSPKSYTYISTYEVQPNNAKYYPIKITYSGTKPNWDKEGVVEPVNNSIIIRFNEQTGTYE